MLLLKVLLVQSSRAHLMQQTALGPALPPERETTWEGRRGNSEMRQVRNGRICVLLHEKRKEVTGRATDVGNYLQQEFAVVRSPGERMPNADPATSIYDVRINFWTPSSL